MQPGSGLRRAAACLNKFSRNMSLHDDIHRAGDLLYMPDPSMTVILANHDLPGRTSAELWRTGVLSVITSSFCQRVLDDRVLQYPRNKYHLVVPFPSNMETPQLKSTRMTLSPLKNILLTKRSLLTPLPPALLFSVHISLTFSNTMLQWRSKALTRASNLRLFRHEMRT